MSDYVLNLVGISQINHNYIIFPKLKVQMKSLWLLMILPELPSKYLFDPPLQQHHHHQSCPSLQSVHVMPAIVVRYDESCSVMPV